MSNFVVISPGDPRPRQWAKTLKRRQDSAHPARRWGTAAALLILACISALAFVIVPCPRDRWIASASDTAPGLSPQSAIDDNPSSFWQANEMQRPGQWFEVDLGARQGFVRVTLALDADHRHGVPRKFLLLGSDDGVNYNNIIAGGQGQSPLTTVDFAPVSFRYFRIALQSEAGDPSQGQAYAWSIGDLQIYQRGWQNPLAVVSWLRSLITRKEKPAPQSSSPPNGFVPPSTPGIAPGRSVNFASGFTPNRGLICSGAAAITAGHVRLADGRQWEVGSVFTSGRINIRSFHTVFRFRIDQPAADGITFTLQGVGQRAQGGGGGGLGFGPQGATKGIPKSAAVKYDLWSNAGEGPNSTGLYLNGAAPDVPAVELPSKLDLHSDHVFEASISYSGMTLNTSLRDLNTGAMARHTYQVNIPAAVGGPDAYVGFTAGTGGRGCVPMILSWWLDR
ncbi:MAG TPA: discoidin domain-containing protein [Armatimonadota bacterium]|nr:discoidin domain-containing protein [Armatimonadota bacterium]